MTSPPQVSLVVPVYNGGAAFVDCLIAIKHSLNDPWELVVVDDGSTDKSPLLARELGARVLSTGGRLGPGAARNLGAQAATGEYVFFIDADCEVLPDTFANLKRTLEANPEVDAFFGSYDDQPKAPNLVAQYKNLHHHHVHQTGRADASTFWSGCGIVRRSVFLELGGFDVERYPRPSIEDIDFGYRLKQAGKRIYLDRQIQVKHHKAWTLKSLVKTDLFDRGIPWTRLILNHNKFVNDLNLKASSRGSVVVVYLLLLTVLTSLFLWSAAVLLPVLALVLTLLNWDVHHFYYRKRGLGFALRVVPLHWLYYLYSGAAFVAGSLLHARDEFRALLPTEAMADGIYLGGMAAVSCSLVGYPLFEFFSRPDYLNFFISVGP